MEIVQTENMDIRSIFYTSNCKLKTCYIEILDNCNFRCSHCYIPSEQHKILTYEMFKKIVDELALLGCQNVTLTGGEPLLHPQFCDFYEYAYSKIPFVSINSNLSILKDKTVDLLKNKKPYSIEASIYGYDEKTYCEFTGIPQIFDKFIENIRKLKYNNIPISLKIPLTTISIKYIDKVILLAQKENLFIKYDYTIFPQLNNLKDRCLNSRLTVQQVMKFITNNDETINFYWNKLREQPSKWDTNLFSCIAGKDAIYIDSHGYIKMCMVMPRMNYNIEKNTITETLEEFKKIRSQTYFSEDNKCKLCLKKKICKFCPARFKLETGSYQKQPDWYCDLANQITKYDWTQTFFIQTIAIPNKKYIKDMFNIIKTNQNGNDEDYEIWFNNCINNFEYKNILCIENNKVVGYLQYFIESDYYYLCEIQIDKKHQGDKKTLLGLYRKFFELNKKEKLIKGKINPNNKHSIDVHTHIGFKKMEDSNVFVADYIDIKKWIDNH